MLALTYAIFWQRCWGGAACQPKSFYEACDAMGILVWVEFWITGDDNGGGGGADALPLDHGLFLQSAESVIRLARAHPSVAIYVGGNEQMPCADLDEGLGKLVAELDGTRCYVSGSVYDGFADGKGAHRPNRYTSHYSISRSRLIYSRSLLMYSRSLLC